MTSPVAHALLVWHPFRSCLVWHPLMFTPCLASPFRSCLVWHPPFAHALFGSPLLLTPCWFGIPFRSCLAVVASPLAHALLVWHLLSLMPCWYGTPFSSCLAAPFTYALLVWHPLLLMPCWCGISFSLMPCCLLRQLAWMLAPHTGLNIREDPGHRGSMRDWSTLYCFAQSLNMLLI